MQVAVSVIDELSRLPDLFHDLTILASDEVHADLQLLGSNLSKLSNYEVFNTYGLSTLWSGLGSKVSGHDVVFTLFGPLYLASVPSVSIVGFAQPWIIYPDNEIYRSFSVFRKLASRLKFFLHESFFKRADRLVVELEHVKDQLVGRGVADAGRVDVVHNGLSSVYFLPKKWKALPTAIVKTKFSIGFVGRDYPHKNTNLLPHIKRLLHDLHDLSVDFYVTFNANEWAAKTEFFRANVNNVGVLYSAQCPTFYQQIDAVIFPSFLECFSATPLEALIMEKPLFASDRGFIRDVCADYAWYFNPENPVEAANLIATYISKHMGHDVGHLAAARQHVIQFSNARQRAVDYFKIMQTIVMVPG